MIEVPLRSPPSFKRSIGSITTTHYAKRSSNARKVTSTRLPGPAESIERADQTRSTSTSPRPRPHLAHSQPQPHRALWLRLGHGASSLEAAAFRTRGRGLCVLGSLVSVSWACEIAPVATASPRSDEAQTPRRPHAQTPRCPDVQTLRRPDAQTLRRGSGYPRGAGA